MSWFMVFLTAVGTVVLAFLLLSAAGLILPRHITGKRTLKRMLIKRGINPNLLPEACVDELVQGAISVASMHRNLAGSYFNSAFSDQLNCISAFVGFYIKANVNDPFDATLIGAGGIASTLEKFGIKAGQGQ